MLRGLRVAGGVAVSMVVSYARQKDLFLRGELFIGDETRDQSSCGKRGGRF